MKRAVFALLVLGAARAASAQNQPVDLEEGYAVERFRPATDRRGILDVESAEIGEPMEIELGFAIGYADDPLNLYRDGEIERQRVGSLVSHRLGGDLIGSVALLPRLQVGVDLPIVFSQDEAPGQLMVSEPAISSFGLGDLRLVPKLQVLAPDATAARVAVAVALGLTVPTGSEASYFGDDGGTLVPEVLVSAPIGDRARAGVNLGYRVRRERQTLDLEIDDELYAHLGAAYQMTPELETFATFSVATPAGDPLAGTERLYSEIRGGASYALGTISIFGAAGAGTSEGFGAPDWRLVTGVRLALPRRREPAPEQEPPALVVTRPPEPARDPDPDRDGVLDPDDRCSTEAEDVDGFEDIDGCPERDNDGDQVADADDRCPLEAGVADRQGCPLPDRDGDKILDPVDNCPDEAGTAENHGCEKEQLVVLSETGIAVLQNVLFETGDATVRLPSYPLLRNVADVLKSHPEIGRVRVEGHTDNQGSVEVNLELSRRRAETVREFLVAQGVAAERLEAVGLGESKPIAENNTAEGRAKNRRVEFVIEK